MLRGGCLCVYLLCLAAKASVSLPPVVLRGNSSGCPLVNIKVERNRANSCVVARDGKR